MENNSHLFSDNFLNAQYRPENVIFHMISQRGQVNFDCVVNLRKRLTDCLGECVGLYSTGAHVCRQCTVIHCAIVPGLYLAMLGLYRQYSVSNVRQNNEYGEVAILSTLSHAVRV